jgi:hypothetical protein
MGSSQPLNLVTISTDDEPPSPERVGPGIALAVVATLLAVLAFGGDLFRAGPTVETSLRHELGQPVDVVEQFVAALNYGQLEGAARALAADADRFELPFRSSPPEPIATTLATFRDTGSAIQMFGCESGASAGHATVVSCSVAYVDDFVRELESEYLRGAMDFLVEGNQIRTVLADLPLPARERYQTWLLDFYTARLGGPPPADR